jgi:uncharacterized protein (TIGR02284 family)
MENQKTITALNKLIEINNDRIEGYETASKETESAELKALFNGLSFTSNSNVTELRAEVLRLGGKPEEGTRVTGKFFRVWMDVKAAFTGNDRHAILSSCEFGEDKALETYEEVLDNGSDLTVEQRAMIVKQQANLRGDHNEVKSLRDASE